MASGREAPTLHKGGSAAGGRSVLLQEPAGEAIGKCFRIRLVDVFLAKALPVQCGAQKSVPLELPMLHARAHLDCLAQQGASGGILLVDARDTYYAVSKHFLFSKGVLDSPAQLDASIARIHLYEQQRCLLAAALAGPGLHSVFG